MIDWKVYVAGHRGLAGSALLRLLERSGCRQIVTANRDELDLRRQNDTFDFLASRAPEVVIVAAARVGGIGAQRDRPADFLSENLAIAGNIIEGSFRAGVPRLLFLASAAIYPKEAQSPLTEENLLDGRPEPVNEPYAIAKIAGIKLCEAIRRQHGVTYHSIIPNNLYGPGDNYHPEHGHVVASLLRRFHEAVESGAEEVVLWGSGRPRREFLHSDDLAAACLRLLGVAEPPDRVNAGSGEEISIRELADQISAVTGFTGRIHCDNEKPDGAPRKRLDTSRLRALGWQPEINLCEGLKQTYQSFRNELAAGTARL